METAMQGTNGGLLSCVVSTLGSHRTKPATKTVLDGSVWGECVYLQIKG